MCSHYEAVRDRRILKHHFRVEDLPEGGEWDMYPGYLGPFIRRHAVAGSSSDAVPPREALLGAFGMIPHWATDPTITRRTYNARSETVAVKPSFRDAWRRAQHCIIPADAFYEPDWRSGRAVPTRISHVDGKPLGIAGLWATWASPRHGSRHSFTMLTINADTHPLMRQFHRPSDEKRMVVILHEERYTDWLQATPEQSAGFLQAYPADALQTFARPPVQRALF